MTEIKAHLRAVIANGSISTTLIQTEDLEALCAAADAWDGVCDLMRDPNYSNEAGGIYVRNYLNNHL